MSWESTGGEQLGEALSRYAPNKQPKSTMAKYNKLARSERGRRFLRDAGFTATSRTQKSWKEGKSKPSRANQNVIDRAHREWAESNIRNRMSKTWYTNIEIHPTRDQYGNYTRNIKNIAVSDVQLIEAAHLHSIGSTAGLNRLWKEMLEPYLDESPPGEAYIDKISHVVIGLS